MSKQVRICRGVPSQGDRCTNITVGESNYCERHGNWFDSDIAQFQEVAEHYRQDLREFWNRSNLYLILQAGLFSFFVTILVGNSGMPRNLMILLSIFGLVLGGSLIWIGRWREATIEANKLIWVVAVYSNFENMGRMMPWNSPSKVTTCLPLLFGLIWLIMIMMNL